jgi:putative protease
MIKLLSPVDKTEEVEGLIEAGADELYCGVLTSDWHNRYIAGSVNRRPGGGASFKTFDALSDCVRTAHAHGIPVFLTLNEHYYTQEQYPFLYEYVARAIDAGVDAFIVADLGLLLTLKEKGEEIKTIISTGGTAFNSETVRFYQDLGASRIILPRHLTIDEIGEISRKTSGVGLEAFILNSRCPNVDGFCTFHHGLADASFDALCKNACMLPFDVSVDGNDPKGQHISLERQQIWQMVHVDQHPCGVCALYEFDKMNMASVKIVGRGNPTQRKLIDIAFIRNLLDFLRDKRPAEDDFRGVARNLYLNTYRRSCRVHMCYYPEVLCGNGTGNFCLKS